MALNLQSLFSQQNIQSGQGTSGGMAPLSSYAQTARAGSAQSAQQLPVGSVVSGQVMETKDGNVTIQTDKGGTIQAHMEEGVSLQKGSFVSFEVSGVSDNRISLKALFTNTAAGSSTMSAALSQAGITENASSFGMVRSMMENGMPIDKNSLLAMYRQVSAHPETSAENIVSMKQLQLPLTDANISQFEAYRNLEHQITEATEQVRGSMDAAIDELFGGADQTKALSFIRDVAQLLSQEPAEGAVGEKTVITETGAPAQEGANPNATATTDQAFIKLLDEAIEGDKSQVATQTQAAVEGAENAANALSNDPKQALLEALKQAQAGNADPAGKADGVSGQAQQTEQAIGKESASPERTLSDLLGKTSGNEALQQIAKGLDELLHAEKTPENAARLAKAAALLQGKDMKDLLGNELSKQWKMTPEMVAGKEDVQEFYTRLRMQTGDLARAAQQALGQDSALTQQAGNLQQNVDFMNQLNQTAAYIQLPLQLAGEDAHGELYVYTNKKSLAENDGKVSAFLHLDMDNLGPVDVYVAMENAKVSTNFYLADDAMIDFISENIHILDERLADRGYNMTCKVSLKENKEPTNVMDEVIEDHKDGFLIGSKSFDVRA